MSYRKKFKMKSAIIFVIVAYFVLLFVTNPTMDKFEQFVYQQLVQDTAKESSLSQALGARHRGDGSRFVADATIMHDYLFASFFEAEFGDDRLSAIGVLNHFIVIKIPASHKTNNYESQSTTGNSEPAYSLPNYQVNEDASKDVNRDTIELNLKVGPITVSTHGKCTPIMDKCESYAILHYRGQSLKIYSVGSPFQPISEVDVSLVDNRYVTINYAGYGNCWNCVGIVVAEFDDGKLYYLGEFGDIKDGYLIRTYDVLEHAGVVSHALAPGWALYFKNIEKKAVLDIKYTCLMAKDDFDKEKNKLLNVLATPKKLDAKSWDDFRWSEENVTAPLLDTLALARYCSWQNESIGILNEVKTNHDNLVTSRTLQEISAALSLVEPAKH